MIRVRATCPMCGEVELPASRFTLTIDVVIEADSTYSFPCPSCRVVVTKRATEDVVHLLMSAGVKPSVVGRVAPVFHQPTGDPPFEIEDLAAFVAELSATDYLAESISA